MWYTFRITGCKTSQGVTSGTFLWHRSQRFIPGALSKEKKTTTKENKTTENVVMINGRSNDGHKKRCCAWRTQESISDVAGVTVGVI